MRVVLHVIFFLSGIATVLIGQVLPVLARRFTLSDLELSLFFPAQFAGSLAGTFLSSRYARRENYLAATLVGTLSMTVGIVLMNADVFAVCLLGFVVNGAGVGLTLPAINMLVVETSRERAASALSMLNFCWGVGAIVCKPFVDLFSGADHLGATTYVLAVPLVAMSLLLYGLGRRLSTAPVPDKVREAVDEPPIWTTSLAWLIALFNFVHVGFESGMGGWLTTYAERVPGRLSVEWLSPTLLYFLFFVTGRGVAPLLFRYLRENAMLFLGLAIVFTGMVIVTTAGSVGTLAFAAAVAGFGTSWIFPTNVARFSHAFGPTATRRATPLFICGTLGAAASTSLIGIVSDLTGSLHSGLYVLLFAVAALIVLQTALALKRAYGRVERR